MFANSKIRMDFKQRKKDKHGKNAYCCNFAKIGASQGNLSFENSFSYSSTKTYVVGTQKNRLNETVLLSTQNIMFILLGKKMITILRSKILLNWTYAKSFVSLP